VFVWSLHEEHAEVSLCRTKAALQPAILLHRGRRVWRLAYEQSGAFMPLSHRHWP